MNKFVKSMLSLALAGSMVATVVPGVAMGETLDTKYVDLTGTMSGDLNARGRFYADYSSLDEALEAGNRLHLQMASEGQVLLKNENGALPLGADERNVTFLGIGSVDYNRGGGGSGATKGTDYKLGWYDAFEQAGFHVNPKTVSMYENLFQVLGGVHETNDSGKLLEPSMSYFSKSVTSTFASYNDVAVVCFSRFGRENMDLATNSVEGHSDPNDHYLQLDDNELELIKLAKANFKKVVVMINSSNIMQIPELNAPVDTEYGVDAILWVGGIGDQGTLVAANILTGEVNPSGHTVDIWPSDFTKDPTFTNFSDMSQNVDEEGNRMDAWLKYEDGTLSLFCDTEFREGIYYGYRYYETKAHDDADGESWYQEAVTYPFGYGLSYTTFDWELAGASDPAITAANQVISVSVKVTNTGSVAGKEVVEVYASAPYVDGGIEKAHKVLVGFAKTELLKPGASETVTVTVDPYTMSSYDYRDANDNGFCGYELEAGDYTLYVGRNAHQEEAALRMTVEDDIQWETDPVTDNEVTNLYTDGDFLDSDWQLDTVLSRSDWEGTWPTAQTAETHKGSDQLYEELKDTEHNNPTDFDSEEYPWFDEETDLTLRSLLPETTPDKTYSAIVDYDDPLWDEILDACNDEEMISLVNNGAYHTLAMETIDLPTTIHGDGPAGFTCFMNQNQVNGTCQYVSEPVMASTWNVELMEEMGEALGDEGLMGDRATGQPYSSIYAPGANIHRSPFGGRCSEYFSEDPFITGMMSAYEVRGMQSKGVIPTVKHFAANEQETHRSINGDSSWLTEQSLREIYLKGFEIAVKSGEARGVMSSFNRIATRWTGGDYRLITQILRNEWGFKGFVICDFNTIPQYMIPRQMFYAGGDLDLATLESSMWTDCDSSDNGDAIVLRNATKNLVYALVNSNAMNAKVIGYDEPLWHSYLLYVNVGLGCIMGIWGVLAFVHAFKLKKKLKEQK